VRHALVQEIINAYERASHKELKNKSVADVHGRFQRKNTL